MTHPQQLSGRAFLRVLALTALFLPALAPAAWPSGWPAGEDGEPTLAPVVKRAQAAVVNISTVTHIEQAQHPLFQDPFFRRFFELPQVPRERRASSLGSGVIIDADQGYVLTNHRAFLPASQPAVS